MVLAVLLSALAIVPASLLQGVMSWLWAELFTAAGTKSLVPKPPLETVLVYSLYGVPGAIVGTAAVGLPIYLLLQRARVARAWIGLVLGVILATGYGAALGVQPAFWPWLAYYGSVVAISFWYLATPREQERPA